MEKTETSNENNNINNIKQNDEYLEILKNNPLQLFDSITKDILDMWKTKLSETETFTKIKNDSQILMKEPNHKLQNIIKNDSDRTRKKEEFLISDFKKILECMLTFYCEKNNIEYKQSINEIFGPLILMKYKIPNLTYVEIYNIGESIINIYLTNYYINPVDINKKTYEIIDKKQNKNSNIKIEKFFPIIPSLELFKLLLKYHEPAIFNLLDKYNIEPQLYAMKWLMTCFFSQLKINILYKFIEYLILINDNLFLHYFLIALIKVNRDKLFKIKDIIKYLPFLTQLTIETFDELSYVISNALELRELTPYSFRILSNKLKLFDKKIPIQQLIKKYKKYSFNNLIMTIPIFPMEIFYITYNEQIKCPNKYCKKNIDLKLKIGYNKKKKEEEKKNNSKIKCELCDMKIIKKKIKYIIIDLRILEYGDFSDENEKTGFLPNMIMVNQDELKSEDFPKILSERFKPNRGNFHFIFITSDSNFSGIDYFYEEEKNDEDDLDKRHEIIFGGGGYEEKSEKKLNLKNVEIAEKKEILKIKEFDIFKSILQSFLKENYPYISFVYGGYNLIHKKSFYYDITLLDHEYNHCILCKSHCNKNKKNNINTIQNLWEHKTKIKYDYIRELSKVDDNFVNFCFLSEINDKKIDNERIQIIICIIFKEHKIEIFKILKKKIYEGDINTYSNQINDKSKYYDIGKDNKEENKEPELSLIQSIMLNDLYKIDRDSQKKNVVTIHFKKSNLQKIIVEFANKGDSKSLIKYCKIYKKHMENKRNLYNK